ncbi:MAG: beta-propeller fold lactonase family protein [Acidobacteria bacterium]|nr:beta-propeller fold lactonase family protein [Acidobacteriota bacterium]
MARRAKLPTQRLLWVLSALLGVAGWMLIGEGTELSHQSDHSWGTFWRPSGSAQLVSMEPLPMTEGAECQWVPASASSTLMAALQHGSAAEITGTGDPLSADPNKRTPLRVIHDDYPSFSSVAIDTMHDEVVVTDENLFQILSYDRRTNTPPRASMSEPKRIIGGVKTKIEFQCGVYIDPKNGDIYAVNNDTVDTLVIFSRNAKGNVPPDRELRTPHGTFGIAVDEQRQELFLSVQHSSAIIIFHKMAKDRDEPLRVLQGNKTLLSDPHGIALDTKNKLLFVTNHGSLRDWETGTGGANPSLSWPPRGAIAGSGRMTPSSITVYASDANGDTAPLRVIQGPKTQLNWPTGLSFDEQRGELYVANDMGNSVLVFAAAAQGDVAPVRVLKGSQTGIHNPTGVFVDQKHGELWVANFGNHTATAYKLPAGGNTAPQRTIRSGPTDEPALMIGNPGAVAYDSKRDEILVPN